MTVGPLTGIKMIECSTWGFGPIGGMMLGDLGADIIKIESPTRPDAARHVLNIAGIDNRMPGDRSALFATVNRNKRSLALDLKTPKGQKVFKELIKGTDILLENYRPGVFDKMGLGYDVLSKINPALIYAATAGYGFKGAEAHKPALDAVGQARSGFMYTMGAPGDPPNWNTMGVADVMGAGMLAYGMLAALAARELQGGKGQRVEVSHIMANMWLSYWGIAVSMLKGYEDWPRFDRKTAGNPLWNLYECSDGEWIMLGIVEYDRHWPGFCDVMELGDVVADPRFKDLETLADGNATELVALLDETFAREKRNVWEKRLDRNPDLIFTRIQHIGDLPSDPAVIANDYLVDRDHKHFGKIKMLSHPVNLTETPASIYCDAPDLGEHSAEVLKDRLGYDDEQIAELVIDGVVA